MSAYYNEIDPFCCRVLRARIADGSLPPGDVDERSIEDVSADDLRGYEQVQLFAGIGGFPLGLRIAGAPDGFPIWTGGFPCQDISVAGRGAGLSGSRSGLFWQLVRAVRVARPRWLLLENVAALLGRGMGDVASALAAIGSDSEWDCIPASAVGAPHRRDRVWIVGYPNGPGRQGVGVVERQEWGEHPETEWAGQGVADPDSGGRRERRDVGRAPGDAGAGQSQYGGADVPIPSRPRLAIRLGPHGERPHAAAPGGGRGPTQSGLGGTADGIPGRLGAALDAWGPDWERGVPRVVGDAPGKIDRRRRLVALGNAVVPQVVAVMARAILAAEAQQ